MTFFVNAILLFLFFPILNISTFSLMILLVRKSLILFVIDHIYVYFGKYETHKHNCDSFKT